MYYYRQARCQSVLPLGLPGSQMLSDNALLTESAELLLGLLDSFDEDGSLPRDVFSEDGSLLFFFLFFFLQTIS